MQFFAGSHEAGFPVVTSTSIKEDGKDDDVNGNKISDEDMAAIRSKHEVVNVELKAGECSIHSELLVHGSLPNASKRRRLAATLSYLKPNSRDLGLMEQAYGHLC